MLVVEEEDDEAHHRHLGDKVEPAPPQQASQSRRSRSVSSTSTCSMCSSVPAWHERAGERADEHEAGDEEEPGARRLEHGQHERGDRAADRHAVWRTPSASPRLPPRTSA